MKAPIIVLIFAGVAFAENCDIGSTVDCAHIVCADPQVPTCMDYLCTCADKPTSFCAIVSDCTVAYWLQSHCKQHDKQCINNECQCIKHHG